MNLSLGGTGQTMLNGMSLTRKEHLHRRLVEPATGEHREDDET